MATYNLTSAGHISITISTANDPLIIHQVDAPDSTYSKEEVETF